jgi:hypothetical protein
MKFPTWLSGRAFVIAAALTTIPVYREAAKTEFTVESALGWVAVIVVCGVIVGAVLTWGEKKFAKNP